MSNLFRCQGMGCNGIRYLYIYIYIADATDFRLEDLDRVFAGGDEPAITVDGQKITLREAIKVTSLILTVDTFFELTCM